MNNTFKDLIKANQEEAPEIVKAVYGKMVEDLLEEEGYLSRDIQAILNNYLDEPENTEYVQEFKALQKCRKQCKAKAREILGIS